MSADTISETKLAVMPIIEMRQMICMARTTVNVAPRAPSCGPGMVAGLGGVVCMRMEVLILKD